MIKQSMFWGGFCGHGQEIIVNWIYINFSRSWGYSFGQADA